MLIEILFFTLDQDFAASVKDLFRSTLHDYHQVIISCLRVKISVIHISDEHVKLNFR
jgi:hypothetical protein